MPNPPLPQLPRLCDLMTPAVQALVAARPKADLHVALGTYGDVLAGWEAQATIWRNYVAAECRAGRLPLAEAEPLIELTGSEFWSNTDRSPQKAVGEIYLLRTLTNTTATPTGQFLSGTIKQGTKFSLTADNTLKPPAQAAQYVSSEPVYVSADDTDTVNLGGGNFEHVQLFKVPLEATTAGEQANVPLVFGVANAQGALGETLFDSTLTVNAIHAAGGSTGVDDPWLRVIAASELAGFFGPNNDALIAGAMEVPRVRRLAVALDAEQAVARVFIADNSWGYSLRLIDIVSQNIAQKWQGWGCRFQVHPTFNQLIGVIATVVVDSQESLAASADIAANIRTSLRSYFDDRPDWYTWRARSVRAAIAHADRRIVTCPSATVHDETDAPISDPPAKLDFTVGFAKHFYLLDNAVRLTFATQA